MNLQGQLVEYKQLPNNHIAMKFYVLDDENKQPVYAYAKCNQQMLFRFQKFIAFSGELYKEEIDLDNIIDKKHLIGVRVEVNDKGNLIVYDFFKIPDDILYDDAVKKGIFASDERVLEEIKKHKPKQIVKQETSGQNTLF